MDPLLLRALLALLASAVIAFRARKRNSLTLSGAVAGFLVVGVHIAAGFRYGALILAFFFSSSKLTKYGEENKRAVDVEFKPGGQRDWVQVLSNSGLATILVVLVGKMTRWQDKCLDNNDSALVTSLVGGIIGHYACCNGDTWSSEYGVLSNVQPRLITSFKKVPKGTNGGVTPDGLGAAVVAGTLIGVTFYVVGLVTATCSSDIALKQLLVIPVAAAAGLLGSLIDSLLGAMLQFSGFCKLRKKVVGKPSPTVTRISGADILNNNGVNFVSVILTTILTGIAFSHIF